MHSCQQNNVDTMGDVGPSPNVTEKGQNKWFYNQKRLQIIQLYVCRTLFEILAKKLKGKN